MKQVHLHAIVVTEQPQISRRVGAILGEFQVSDVLVEGLEIAIRRIGEQVWDFAVIDLSCQGDIEGLLEIVRQENPELPMLLFHASRLGRSSQARLPVTAELIQETLDEGLLRHFIETLLPSSTVPLAAVAEDEHHQLYRIAGCSQKFLKTIDLAEKVAPTSVPVLITGESGTGKELISRMIHCCSNRNDGPFIHVNCAALSESLLESELFGHEKGAFTGAHQRRIGRFERAHGGTLLLDEISETTPKLQAELLRVLEQQDFERVGGSEMVRVNVRVISTSNRDLADEVEQGRFRRDLYYRIGGIHLNVPPIRERREDIKALVWHFVNLYAPEVRRRITRLDDEMMSLFEEYHWPGNVRQLRNIVRAALILGEGPILSLDGAEFLKLELQPERTGDSSTLHLREMERQAILEALRRTKSNQAKAAQLLGITDRTLREKIRRYREEGQLQPSGEHSW